MPRVKTLLAEIGTTGVVERFDLTGNAAEDIGRAVELEHYCEESHCDISTAAREGFPYSAAYLLSGATETPLLDQVCQFYGFDASEYPDEQDWNLWNDWHTANSRECPSCGSYNYSNHSGTLPDQCSNCLATFPPIPNFEIDAFISPIDHGRGYAVTVEERHLDSFEDREQAESFLWQWTEDHGFFPETWLVNERGNTELLVRTDNPEKPYTWGDVGYV